MHIHQPFWTDTLHARAPPNVQLFHFPLVQRHSNDPLFAGMLSSLKDLQLPLKRTSHILKMVYLLSI